jgi:CDP-glucose 4,6-dehydratase
LQSLDAVVKGYSLAPETENNLFNIVFDNLNFENVIADIRDAAKLEKEILNFQPDIIFHLAAQALVRKSYQVPSQTFDINVVGTCNVLEAVHKLEKKCTIIVITTDKVYENKEQNYYYKESDVLGGYDPYSASKAAAEIAVISFRNSFFNRDNYQQHQKAIVCARAGNVIGGGDWSNDRIVPDIVRALQNSQPIQVRNPNAVRPWQHVLEPLNGYLNLAKLTYENYAAISNAYNFGPLPTDHLPVNNLVSIAIKCWGSGEWKDTSTAKNLHEAGILMLDISKATKELNWIPKLQSQKAIEWAIDWYKQPYKNAYLFTMEQIKKYQVL